MHRNIVCTHHSPFPRRPTTIWRGLLERPFTVKVPCCAASRKYILSDVLQVPPCFCLGYPRSNFVFKLCSKCCSMRRIRMSITVIPIGHHTPYAETNSGITNRTASNLLSLVRIICSTLRCLATCASASEAERLLALTHRHQPHMLQNYFGLRCSGSCGDGHSAHIATSDCSSIAREGHLNELPMLVFDKQY